MPQRQAVSTEQRRQLRAFSRNNAPRPSQRRCVEWFYQTYNERISQATVSHSLSARFAALDSPTTLNSSHTQRRQRARAAQWPELEAILVEWQKSVEAQGGLTSQDLLRAKAQEIWACLLSSSNQPSPEFSHGWLRRFQLRHGIAHHLRHGKAGSVPTAALEASRASREEYSIAQG